MRLLVPILVCFYTSILSSCCCCDAIDVSWIPSKGDEPLPLSTTYRDKLRRLCALLDSRMPPEIEEKRDVLEKQCARLASDDANGVGIAQRQNKVFRKGALFATTFLGAAWWVKTQRPDWVEGVLADQLLIREQRRR
mmetsp:Transcript_14193/g.21880  ORF Transcript_14193/g.21880 Transcript_14193/m.21880 type:complete len:137 (+) Transcript_14193:146-556(+)